jgi:uncharacterized damage-inducible protein DinB
MNAKNILLRQFDTSYNENGWFVALKNAIAGITAEQAAWKPEGADNSIWGILSHLNYYNHAYLQRFRGIEYEYTKSTNEETFESGGVSEGDWRAEVDRFDSIMSVWRHELKNADESKFNELAPPRNESLWWEVIANINTHNAHHGGQIVLLRKLQGSWNTEMSVS